MDRRDVVWPILGNVQNAQKIVNTPIEVPETPNSLPPDSNRLVGVLSPFWHDRLIEIGMVLSMALFYLIGNTNLGTNRIFELSPLYSLPFLLLFALLCWYRLSFAVALLPLALPYYLLPKTIIGHYSFSPAEIVLVICAVVAVLQLFVPTTESRASRSGWRELRDKIGPFALPVVLFLLIAAFSIVIAYEHKFAFRAFYEEVLAPIVYLLLVLYCLRSRTDLLRLLGALIATGLIVALMGLSQYFLFKNQLKLESDGVRRVHAVYGSANSIGLFFDYVLPVVFALAVARTRKFLGMMKSKWLRILAIAISIPLLMTLYLSQSGGAWIAIAVASLFILTLSIRNRKVLLIGGIATGIATALIFFFFHRIILEYMFNRHESVTGVSTITKRIYLWQSALRMIHDHFWFGVGMENWLCYYSYNTICHLPAKIQAFHYWIITVPGTKQPTGLTDEPTLSHPHNIFLHVWVSIGFFGFLAFLVILVLFFWLFTRILINVRSATGDGSSFFEWMTIGIGAAMVAALVQGLGDSSFLVQDLSFCFWLLVAALLVLRKLTNTSWIGRLQGGDIKVSPGLQDYS